MTDKKTAIKESISKLNAEKVRLDKQLSDLEVQYVNTAVSTGAVIKQLDELSKTANGFNRTTQKLNIGYFLSTILQIEVTIPKPEDPSEVKRVSIWTGEQNKFMRDFLYRVAQDLDKNE